ncbi:YciI family protein [Intrasporangium sp.]|uniref:YciI family protein n=1 Tax=Intrasporangium sp. TaxID=1925024 RepID=UPI00293AAA75|nr:YciI family protein [Intrasporangium sp.]MDV3220215.1 YciI family protein [Intrasporangium sp.]
MADTYLFLIHEPDWDSDAYLTGDGSAAPEGRDPSAPAETDFPEHAAFQAAVAELGARIVGGAALQHSKYGGTVKDDVYTDGPFTDTSEVITGFYLVETDEATARKVAALVPSGGHVEWRKVFPTG